MQEHHILSEFVNPEKRIRDTPFRVSYKNEAIFQQKCWKVAFLIRENPYGFRKDDDI